MKRSPMKRTSWMSRGKGPSLRRTPLRKANPQRVARRAKQYRTVIASDFHKQLRYRAFLRSGGLCECESCVGVRKNGVAMDFEGGKSMGDGTYQTTHVFTAKHQAALTLAHAPIPCWFTKRGAEPWQRFRSKDGELHHVSYAKMGQENPDELRLVQWVWKTCHQRIEAEHGTRRRYLAGAK